MSRNPPQVRHQRAAVGREKPLQRRFTDGVSGIVAQDLGEVLVAAPAERHEGEPIIGRGLAQQPGDRVRGPSAG